LHHHVARTGQNPVLREARRTSIKAPREMVLNLLAQGYPLEELLEFFPMLTLHELLVLIEDPVIH